MRISFVSFATIMNWTQMRGGLLKLIHIIIGTHKLKLIYELPHFRREYCWYHKVAKLFCGQNKNKLVKWVAYRFCSYSYGTSLKQTPDGRAPSVLFKNRSNASSDWLKAQCTTPKTTNKIAMFLCKSMMIRYSNKCICPRNVV